jgi:hypothetical protein
MDSAMAARSNTWPHYPDWHLPTFLVENSMIPMQAGTFASLYNHYKQPFKMTVLKDGIGFEPDTILRR